MQTHLQPKAHGLVVRLVVRKNLDGACAGGRRFTAKFAGVDRTKARILFTMKALSLPLKVFKGLVKTFPLLLKLAFLPGVKVGPGLLNLSWSLVYVFDLLERAGKAGAGETCSVIVPSILSLCHAASSLDMILNTR